MYLFDPHPFSIEKQWQGLTNGLAGLFCASLGALNEKRTIRPHFAFKPRGDLPSGRYLRQKLARRYTDDRISLGVPHSLFYAPLPSESVCTENLTPFLKLLPCKSSSGIAMLLNPYRVFDADWHGIGVHFRSLGDQGLELRLKFQAVFDPVRLSGRRCESSCTLGANGPFNHILFSSLVASVDFRPHGISILSRSILQHH